jgi:hypothetical protein
MQRHMLAAVVACLLGAMLSLLPAGGTRAGLSTVPDISSMLESQSLIQPARVWRDCQRIARCHGCAPVYRCRACEYQRQCRYGQCQWSDVCVWGPYIPLAPKGVPVY